MLFTIFLEIIIKIIKILQNRLKTLCFTGTKIQINSSRGHQEQGKHRTQVSTQDSRYGRIDGKT